MPALQEELAHRPHLVVVLLEDAHKLLIHLLVDLLARLGVLEVLEQLESALRRPQRYMNEPSFIGFRKAGAITIFRKEL